MTANEWAKKIYENAVAHGWWETPRPYTEMLALCHSELSEALEADRAGEPLVWVKENGKLEGAAVELADCVIRILDYLGHIGADVPVNLLKIGTAEGYHYKSFPDFIAYCHFSLACSLTWMDEDDTARALVFCVRRIVDWFDAVGKDLETVLEAKHTYNVGRPYKHGKRY